MGFSCVIFDLDGVIVDTAKYHFLGWKRLANSLGFDIAESDDKKLKGVSRMKALSILLSLKKLDPEDFNLEELADKKNKWYKEYISTLTTNDLLPGSRELIELLKRKNIPVALGSASRNARYILERLELLNSFNVIVDGEVVSVPKPAPDVFLKSAEMLSVHPRECIVVEDSEAGITAANNAGMFSISVGSNNFNSNAALNIEDLCGNEIPELFN